LIQIVWEFTVREDRVAEFEKFYSSTGSWAALFQGSPGFLGTALLRDTQTSHRYVTIDRWDSAASHQLMRERFAKEYAAMDLDCEALTESERQIGVFEDA
jgi:heme-degrading monooxygenase HmoA